MSDPSRVVVSGPLSAFVPGFLDELLGQGYRPGTAAKQLQLMAHLSRWMAERDLEPGALRGVEIERFVEDRRASGRVQLASVRGAGSAAAVPARCGGRAVDSDPAFSPDGNRIAFIRNDSTLMTMTSTGRRLERATKVVSDVDADIYLTTVDWQPRARALTHGLSAARSPNLSFTPTSSV